MFEALNNIDTQWFYFINRHHCTAMDYVMWFFSSKWCWFLAMLLAYLFTVFRGERKMWWLPLVAMGLCFLLADQSSNLIKDTVCRLRPCWALDDVVMFHTNKGGKYGFLSSHAANAFALVGFYWFRYRKWEGHTRWGALAVPIGLLVWALLTAYSRPYLGKHYPGDVICGALLGLLIGYVVHLITRFVEKKLQKIETK